MPDVKEIAKRKFFENQVPLREALQSVIEAVMADQDLVLAAEALNYGDDELDEHAWVEHQHRIQVHQRMNLLNEVRPILAEIEEKVRAEFISCVKMASEADRMRRHANGEAQVAS